MDYYTIILPPLVGAVIGWFTNYVAVKMLFRPHRPVNILGWRFQGLIPKRRKEIARSIANAIERELLSAKDFAPLLEGLEWEREVEKTVEEVVEHRLGADRIRRFPIIGLVSDNLIHHIKYFLTKEILKHIDERKSQLVGRFQDRLDLREMIVSRIDTLDLVRFEALLTGFIARELRHIEWIGGLLGFVIGCIQVGLMYIL